MNNKLLIYISILIIITSIIIFSLVNIESMNVTHISVKELTEDPNKYMDKAVIVNGIITKIYNGKVIHALWDNNRMIVLNIPSELKQQVITNTEVEVKGIFKVANENYWLDVKEIIRLEK